MNSNIRVRDKTTNNEGKGIRYIISYLLFWWLTLFGMGRDICIPLSLVDQIFSVFQKNPNFFGGESSYPSGYFDTLLNSLSHLEVLKMSIFLAFQRHARQGSDLYIKDKCVFCWYFKRKLYFLNHLTTKWVIWKCSSLSRAAIMLFIIHLLP